MKSNNIWKIVIGAVSAALGYILNAIGNSTKKIWKYKKNPYLCPVEVTTIINPLKLL